MNEHDTSAAPPGSPRGEPEAISVWSTCLSTLRSRVNSQSFKTWFEPIVPLGLEERVFTIRVPSQFFYEWLEEHYYSLLHETLTSIVKREVTIAYEVVPEERGDDLPPPAIEPETPASPGRNGSH